MNKLIYVDNELIDLEDKEKLSYFSDLLKHYDYSYKYFMEKMQEQFNCYYQDLNDFFFEDKNKYDLVFKINIDTTNDNRYISLERLIFINLVDDAFYGNNARLSNLLMTVPRTFNLDRVNGQTNYKTLEEIELLIEGFEQHMIENLLCFKNLVLFASHDCKNQGDFKIVKKGLGRGINWIEEIKERKKMDLDIEFSTNSNILEMMDRSINSDDFLLQGVNIDNLLVETYEMSRKHSSLYQLLIELKEEYHLESINLKDDLLLEVIAEHLKADNYVFKSFNHDLDLIIIKDDWIDNSEVIKVVNDIIFDNYLDPENNTRVAADFVIEMMDDVNEIVGELITGMYDRRGSGESLFNDIKLETLNDEILNIIELSKHTELRHEVITVGEDTYQVLYKKWTV